MRRFLIASMLIVLWQLPAGAAPPKQADLSAGTVAKLLRAVGCEVVDEESRRCRTRPGVIPVFLVHGVANDGGGRVLTYSAREGRIDISCGSGKLRFEVVNTETLRQADEQKREVEGVDITVKEDGKGYRLMTGWVSYHQGKYRGALCGSGFFTCRAKGRRWRCGVDSSDGKGFFGEPEAQAPEPEKPKGSVAPRQDAQSR